MQALWLRIPCLTGFLHCRMRVQARRGIRVAKRRQSLRQWLPRQTRPLTKRAKHRRASNKRETLRNVSWSEAPERARRRRRSNIEARPIKAQNAAQKIFELFSKKSRHYSQLRIYCPCCFSWFSFPPRANSSVSLNQGRSLSHCEAPFPRRGFTLLPAFFVQMRSLPYAAPLYALTTINI